MIRQSKILIVLALLAAVALVVPHTGSFGILLSTRILVFAILAMSLDILLGYTGLASMGHAAYLGMGAYLAAILATKYQFGLDWTFWFVILFGPLLGAATAAFFGLFAIRATGVYFIMITLALSQCVWGLAYRWNSLTGGDNGINIVRRPSIGVALSNNVTFFYLVLAFFCASLLIMYLFVRSPFGRSLKGIRERELRMGILGYNVWLHKYMAFIIAGAFGGLSGVLWAHTNGIVTPEDVNITTSIDALLVVVLGGAGTLVGGLIGSAVVLVLREYLSTLVPWWQYVLGVVFVLTIFYLPTGLMGLPKRIRNMLVRPSRTSTPPLTTAPPSVPQSIVNQDIQASQAEPILELQGLSKGFHGLHAVRDVTLQIRPGERKAIIGPNGAGKTTLFNLITGIYPVTSGQVLLFGRDVTSWPSHRRASLGMARTFQVTSLFPTLSVLDNVLLAINGPLRSKFVMWRMDTSYREMYEKAYRLLGQVDFLDRKDVEVQNLSHGEQRQLEIVLGLASDPKILLLDEPAAGLSSGESTEMAEFLTKLDPKLAILLIEHDMDVVFDVADEISVLHFGEILESGAPENIKKSRRVQEIYLGTD